MSMIHALWYMLPAYIANPSAVLFKGNIPMDFGKVWRDGKRLLGDGKTWRGFTGGCLAGMFIGCLQQLISILFHNPWLPAFSFRFTEFVLVTFLLSFGAMTGDMVKSFFKRRLGKKRGEKFPLADQYDFVLGAFIFILIPAYDWFRTHMGVVEVLTIFILTPLLHRGVNIVGYRMGKKKEPW